MLYGTQAVLEMIVSYPLLLVALLDSFTISAALTTSRRDQTDLSKSLIISSITSTCGEYISGSLVVTEGGRKRVLRRLRSTRGVSKQSNTCPPSEVHLVKKPISYQSYTCWLLLPPAVTCFTMNRNHVAVVFYKQEPVWTGS